MHEITEAQADRFHMIQTLTGDVTDGYPGCPGIGPVKAEQILNVRETVPAGADPSRIRCRRYVACCVEAFKKAKLTEPTPYCKPA
jgi:hypothetical protein